VGRHKKEVVIQVPEGMPAAPEVQGGARELMAAWMKERIQQIDAENRDRIELLRTVGEHPSPIFQNIVQTNGALGMPKSLVAKMLGLTVVSLDRYYADDYDLGKLSALRSVAANAIRIASSPTDPNAGRVAMQILDRRGGDEWKPPKIVTEDDSKKAPLIDATKLTYEERQQLRIMLERVAAGGQGDSEGEELPPQPGMDLIE
jgi:hypothetical protein